MTSYGWAGPGKDNQDDKVSGRSARCGSAGPENAVWNRRPGLRLRGRQPQFDGHELCTDQPWVQGMRDPAPFHPTAAGELAITAAILPQLPG